MLLDRHRLPVERPNFQAGLADRHREPGQGDTVLYGAAPRNFHVIANSSRHEAFLWIGIDQNPHLPNLDRQPTTCFAVIDGQDLREFAEAVLRCYPAARKGGAK